MDVSFHGTLAALTRTALAGSDEATLFQATVAYAAETLSVPHSAIWELLPDGRTLLRGTSVGWIDSPIEPTYLPVSAIAPVNLAIFGTAPVFTASWQAIPQIEAPALLRARGVTSSLYVGIPGPGHPYRLLGVDATDGRHFDDNAIACLQVAANLLALAVENGHVKQSQQQVEQLAIEKARLIAAAQEKAVLDERQRLARELHDSVSQSLYSVTLHAMAARRTLVVGDVSSAIDNLDVLQQIAQEVLDELRLLIFELRPARVSQVGLAAALQARLSAVEGRAILETQLICNDIADLPLPVEEALYRIAQEALNNALRHARAKHITVKLCREQEQVSLDISDDGIGFDPAAARQAGGFGLCGIEERVAQLNGRLTVWSAPGAGTELRVEIAL